MTKLEALQHLQSLGITAGDAGFAVANKISEKSKIAKKGEIKVKAVKTVAVPTATETTSKDGDKVAV
jgi:uncharacterized protein YoaH (UPF0181 family)